MGRGGGWEYSWSSSLYFNASMSSCSGRKGNLSVISWTFGGSLV